MSLISTAARQKAVAEYSIVLSFCFVVHESLPPGFFPATSVAKN